VKPLRELARIIGRQFSRLRLILERRQLARLESALGLLGWQQADYDGPTQAEVQRLTDYEREQARLTNEGAQLGIEALKLEEKRRFEEQKFARVQTVSLKQAQPPAADEDVLAELVNIQRKGCREIEARLPVIDREIEDAEQQYRALVVKGQTTPEVQAQLLQWHKVIMSLPRERAEWAAKLRQAETEAARVETLLKELKAARTQFEKQDQELAEEIAGRQRSKRKVEKQIETLEKAKIDPYREIGRALADHLIAPLNQPEALTVVLEKRRKIAGIEEAIDASLAESAREVGAGVWKCWLLAGGLIGSEAVAFLAIDSQ
jgi:chromosome segregation ATPase